MPTKDTSSRRDKILELIIESYVTTAVPIASRAISRRLRSTLSPATIRNVMSDLEEMELITHPHTSAGRIPTEKGYRYYIDKLMQQRLLTQEEKKAIDKDFKSRVSELDEILDKTSNILSSITNQAGIVLSPVLQESRFKHVELIRLDNSRLLAVLMTNSGMAEDFIIDIDEGLEERDLSQISNFINTQMPDGSLSRIRKDIMQRLLAERDSFFYTLEQSKNIIDTMLDIIKEDKLYLDGRTHMAEQPEFTDIGKLRNIFKHLEDDDFLFPLLRRDTDGDGIKVYIGSELDDDLSDCSMITASYSIGDSKCGKLGIIGPTRMEYPRFVSMVDYVASTLSRILS